MMTDVPAFTNDQIDEILDYIKFGNN